MSEETEQDRIKLKMMTQIIDDLDCLFKGRETQEPEVLAILGGKVAEILLKGKLDGFLWMSFFGSMISTMLENVNRISREMDESEE
jgi:hypothetical protein